MSRFCCLFSPVYNLSAQVVSGLGTEAFNSKLSEILILEFRKYCKQIFFWF